MTSLKKVLHEIKEMQYPIEGIGCGLEDVGITDRYEAAEYGWNEAVDMVCDLIQNYLPDMDNNGWIPVEERLPEEGQEVWISVKTDCVRRGMYTKCFGFGMREGFICSDGFVDINAVNAWKLYIMPEPYCPKAKVPERKQEWKERMLRNFLRGHETIRG